MTHGDLSTFIILMCIVFHSFSSIQATFGKRDVKIESQTWLFIIPIFEKKWMTALTLSVKIKLNLSRCLLTIERKRVKNFVSYPSVPWSGYVGWRVRSEQQWRCIMLYVNNHLCSIFLLFFVLHVYDSLYSNIVVWSSFFMHVIECVWSIVCSYGLLFLPWIQVVVVKQEMDWPVCMEFGMSFYASAGTSF